MKDNFADIGFAKLDLSRGERTGFSEAIYCAGKTKEQLWVFYKNSKQKALPF